MSLDRSPLGVRFWLIAIPAGIALFVLFKFAGSRGGILFGAIFAQAVVIAIVLLTNRRYPPRGRE